ncbi:MAG TPA: hypothetical protein ENN85_03205 [Methanoculleus sp.]|nr:hypothetical protein [Methanoculleus sp.]
MAFTIITCSGISNTGKLTTQTGSTLLYRCGREIEAYISATHPTQSVEEAIGHAEKILILDGCADCCGRKTVSGRCESVTGAADGSIPVGRT